MPQTVSAARRDSRASSDGRRRTAIRLTPLIDVVFILLVFFMLASTFAEWRAIDLATPGKSGATSSAEGAVLVEIRTEGLRLSGTPMPLDALVARIEGMTERRSDLRIVVKPARGIPLQRTVRVLDRLTAAGVADLSLIRDAGG